MGIITTLLALIVFIALIPILVISTIIIIRDKERENVKTLVKYFILGIISVIIATVFYAFDFIEPNGDYNFVFVFLSVFFGVSVVEELSKWISVKIGMIKDIEYDNMYDGILFAMIVSLGFAGVENILYVFSSIGSFTGLYLVAVVRAFLAVPGHAIYGLFMGLFLEKAKICKLNDDDFGHILNHGLSLFVPILFHTIYDSILIYCSGDHLLETKMVMLLVFIIYIVIVNIVAIILLIKSSNKSGITFESTRKKKISHIIFCSNCGTRIDGDNYCSGCGYKVL